MSKRLADQRRSEMVHLWWSFAPLVIACNGDPAREDRIDPAARTARARLFQLASQVPAVKIYPATLVYF